MLLDLRPEDFQALKARWAKSGGIVSVGNDIQRTRVWLKYCYDADLIDRPVRVGPQFKRATKKIQRMHKAKQVAECGKKLFEAAEIRGLLATASPPLKAMILLAVNGGLGNSDVANLPVSHRQTRLDRFPSTEDGCCS